MKHKYVGNMIHEYVAFVALIGPIQIVVRYKGLELRREIRAEDTDLELLVRGWPWEDTRSQGMQIKKRA